MGPTWEEIRAALDVRPAVRLAEPIGTRAAVAVILREAAAGIEVLFIRRAEHPEDPWSGHMAFPGGRVEPGDADLRATAVRETREEIGLDLAGTAELLGTLDELRAMARMQDMNLGITPFVFRLRESREAAVGVEVTSVHWLPLGALFGPGLQSTMSYVHQGVSLEFPCLRFEELVIWGLTYRMFMGFRERFLAEAEGPERPAAGARG